MLPTSLQSGGSEYISPKKDSQKTWLYVKILGLAALVLVGAFFVGSFLSKIFRGGIPDTTLFSPLLVAVIVFLVFFFLLVFLINVHTWVAYVVALVSALLIILPIREILPNELWIVGVVVAMLLCWSVWSGRREFDASIKIRFVKTLRVVLSSGMWGIVLLASFLVYQSSIARPADAYTVLFPQSVFKSVTPAAEAVLKPILGDVDFSLTLREMAGQGIDTTVKSSLGIDVQRSLTPQLRDALVERYVAQAQETFQKTLGITVHPDQKISDALYQGLLAQFIKLKPETQRGIVVFFSILFLFGLRAISWLLGIVIIPIAFVLYEIAILTGFAHRSFTQEPKEHIGIQ